MTKISKVILTSAVLLVIGGGCASDRGKAPIIPSPVIDDAPTADPVEPEHTLFDATNPALRDVTLGSGFAPGTPLTTVSSPFTLSGEASGWYFEASFPITVLDSTGKVVGTGIAQAQGDWMTSDYVPFTAKVDFTVPADTTGTIVFAKDNPSGLPENDSKIEMPVTLLAN